MKFEMHASADEVFLEHGAAPRGAVNARRRQLGTEDRVAGDPRFVPALADDGVDAVLRLNLKHCSRREPVQVHAAFDLGFDQIVIDLVAQVRTRREQWKAGAGVECVQN